MVASFSVFGKLLENALRTESNVPETSVQERPGRAH